ncbi:MAG: hypothetical protein IJA52_01080 [Clostridia bacterium]|nr:hypothetical protein [Clostridia bacterium]
MGTYLWGILIAGIFVAVVRILSPDGEKGKLGKYLSFIGSLAVAIAILSPLMQVIGSFVFSQNAVETEKGNKGQREAEYYANSAGRVLSEMYEIPLSSINAKVSCSDAGEIENIVLELCDKAVFDEKEAGEILSNIFQKKIQVVSDE